MHLVIPDKIKVWVVAMGQTTNYSVLAKIDISVCKSIKDLFNDLMAVKKEVYQDYERIHIVYRSDSQKDTVIDILNYLDIPDYFVLFDNSGNGELGDISVPDSFCVYPWNNLRVFTTGAISPCCLFDGSIPKHNIKDVSIKEAYTSGFMQNLRQSFLNGDKPKQCFTCWSAEDAGQTSMRQFAKTKFKDTYYQINKDISDIENLKSLDLSLGNLCNLECKICNPHYSSSIAQSMHKNKELSDSAFNTIMDSTNWADSDKFWNEMDQLIPNLTHLDLYGGEPLMNKLHFKFLQKLIDLDVAKNISITYSTNGTVYSEKFFEYWKHFKCIKLSFSIDDIEERFEEQRVNAKWKEVCQNIQKYNARKSDKLITEFLPTINSQNVFYFPELLQWIDTQDCDHLAFNVCHFPYKYNLASIDQEQRTKIIKKLENYQSYDIIKSIISMLKKPSHTTKTDRQYTINKV